MSVADFLLNAQIDDLFWPTMTPDTPEAAVLRWLPWAKEQVGILHEYGPNFDGYGAAAPTQEAIVEAMYLLANLRAQFGIPDPCVAPVRDGGVNLEWEIGNNALDIEIDPHGGSTFLFKAPKTNTRTHGPAVENDQPTPSFMLSLGQMFE